MHKMLKTMQETQIEKSGSHELPALDVKIQETTEKLMRLQKEKEFETRLERFLMLVNKPVDKGAVRARQQFQYIPISVIENQLDEIFMGQWKIVNFKWQQIANEIVGSVELHVMNPVSKEWIVRTGAGGVQIRQKKDTEIAEILQYKIKDTLGMDFPHLLSECIKNAAKKLGQYFGRNLNRDFQDSYEPIFVSMQAKLKSNLENLLKEKKELNGGEVKQ